MEFETLRFDMAWRLDIFDFDMMSYDNLIFNISASIFSISVFRYRVRRHFGEIIVLTVEFGHNITIWKMIIFF